MSRWRHPVSYYVGVGLAIVLCAAVAAVGLGLIALIGVGVLRTLGVTA